MDRFGPKEIPALTPLIFANLLFENEFRVSSFKATETLLLRVVSRVNRNFTNPWPKDPNETKNKTSKSLKIMHCLGKL